MKKLSLKIVRQTDHLYWRGRRLVQDVYSTAWGTPPGNLSDDYDFAVLVCDRDDIMGNLNIKRRTAETLLPSEKYFQLRHWEAQCATDPRNVAELCSLAVCDSMTNRERIQAFNGLIVGSHLLAMHQGIQMYATVQRTALINTLIRLMKYPFFPSANQGLSAADIPQDRYWTTEPMPRLYYVLSDTVTDSASFKLLNTFLLSGLSIDGIAPAVDIALTQVPDPRDAAEPAVVII